MSRTRNGCIRCDWCGRLTRDKDAHYRKPDGTYGVVVQPEWTRFPGGDPTVPSIPDDRDICEECAADLCPGCGGGRIVRTTPAAPGPTGWGGRCKDCDHTWGVPTSPGEDLPP